MRIPLMSESVTHQANSRDWFPHQNPGPPLPNSGQQDWVEGLQAASGVATSSLPFVLRIYWIRTAR